MRGRHSQHSIFGRFAICMRGLISVGGKCLLVMYFTMVVYRPWKEQIGICYGFFGCADCNSVAEDCSLDGEYWVAARIWACFWTCKYFGFSAMVSHWKTCLSVLNFHVQCCQVRASDAQVFGDGQFESRLELFKVKMVDIGESFWRLLVVSRDQGFFLCRQMLDFLHRP